MNERKKPGPKPKIERGKTGVDLPPAMQGTEKGLVAGSREEVAHSSGRPKRVSMNNMKKLEIPKHLMEEGYYHRWFQDRDGRITQAYAAYYEHVIDEQGNNLSCQSGPYTMYAMRLPQKYRDIDNKLKKERVAATLDSEAQIGHDPAGNQEYAPDPETGKAEGGKSAIRHHES